jgi:hypothetical protein
MSREYEILEAKKLDFWHLQGKLSPLFNAGI